jgi:hypothetical protein
MRRLLLGFGSLCLSAALTVIGSGVSSASTSDDVPSTTRCYVGMTACAYVKHSWSSQVFQVDRVWGASRGAPWLISLSKWESQGRPQVYTVGWIAHSDCIYKKSTSSALYIKTYSLSSESTTFTHHLTPSEWNSTGRKGYTVGSNCSRPR